VPRPATRTNGFMELGRRVRKAASRTLNRGFFDLAVRHLARSDKSSAAVTDYLVRRGASRSIATVTVRRLEQLGYLNDAAHAARWSERRLAQKPMGRLRLSKELLQRGFSASLVEDTMDGIYATLDETDLAVHALSLRDRRDTIAQLRRFLESRGFAQEIIVRVLHLEPEE
jgi:SOS response regulatory protein OraA/RecX